MLSKKEYLTHLDYGIKTCPAIYDAFKELIDEHFEPKENTSEFEHFKLHSDCTLKSLTKDELIGYIKMLYHNWGVCDERLKRIIDKAKELSNSNDELRKQLYFIEPYKFKDLKPNMWVWDDEFKDCIKIKIVFEPCKLYPKGSLKAYHDLNEEQLNFIEFEENRFYPVEKANEVQL